MNRVLHEAANLCYRETNDEVVKGFITKEMHHLFDSKVEAYGKVDTVMRVDFDPQDISIQRTEIPHYVHIWLTYGRTVKMPFVGGERQVVFNDHAEQDLSPVKW